MSAEPAPQPGSTWNRAGTAGWRAPRWPAGLSEGPDFAAIRAEFDVPEEFPPEVLAEAEAVAAAPPLPDLDATDIPLVTVDPAGSRDLDQAVHLQRSGTGYLVRYAIADVGAVVRPGGALDTEARRRGQTLYTPDRRVPLHPPVLSEGAASLLPGEDRAAALWTIRLDADGEATEVDVRRARVRSRAQLAYPDVQRQADAGQLPEALAVLPELGRLLQQRALERGAVELGTPEQQVERGPDGGWTLTVRGDLPVEGWNAAISLLTGRCAAVLMLDGGRRPAAHPAAAGARGGRGAAPARPAARRRLARGRGAGGGGRRARPGPARARRLPRGGRHTAPGRRVHAVRRRSAGAARARRRRRALRPRHRPAAPAGRPVRHRGVPRPVGRPRAGSGAARGVARASRADGRVGPADPGGGAGGGRRDRGVAAARPGRGRRSRRSWSTPRGRGARWW